MRGKKKEGERGKTAAQLLWSLQYKSPQSQHCVWLPREKALQWIVSRIYFCVWCSRKAFDASAKAAVPSEPGGPEQPGAAVLREFIR